MPKYNVLFARFPYQNAECPDSTDWLIRTCVKAHADPRIGEVNQVRFDDTPVTMTRNMMIEHAKKVGADLLCLIDSDMAPDCEPDGKPFWETTLDFMLAHEGPCVVGAPYCGPPPLNSPYVFRWCNAMNDGDAYWPDMRLEMYSREDAAVRAGFELVAALPTGLMMLDMRVIERLTPPYFYYEWSDKFESKKGSTEDVTFTRDLSFAKVPLYVNWDAWAGHWKRYMVKKPRLIHVDHVKKKFREALEQDKPSDRKLVMFGEGQPIPDVAPMAQLLEA